MSTHARTLHEQRKGGKLSASKNDTDVTKKTPSSHIEVVSCSRSKKGRMDKHKPNQPMNTFKHTTITLLTITCVISGTVLAQEEGRVRKGAGRPAKEEILKKFDADGDGKLSEAERTEARNQAKSLREAADTDGDGKISPAEKLAAFKKRLETDEKLAARVKEKFDTNQDGELSDEELALAAKARNASGATGKEDSKGPKKEGNRSRKDRKDRKKA